MKIRFNIHFHTTYGQILFIVGSIPELGNWDTQQAKIMFHKNNGMWYTELDLPNQAVHLLYRYFVKSEDKLIFEEWNTPHRLTIFDTQSSYYLLDCWQLRRHNPVFYSSAFVKNWFARPCNTYNHTSKYKKKLLIRISAPLVAPNERIVLLGNHETLGNWNLEKALPVPCENFPDWQIELNLDDLPKTFEYKFCIINSEEHLFRWEQGENRHLDIPLLQEEEILIVSGLQFKDEEPQWKCAGLSIPIFSLKTKNSFGIGDFDDLRQMIDWAKMTNQKIIQILPINDTTQTHTWRDSYPYNAISIYALHPLYLNLQAIGTLKDPLKDTFYKAKQEELNKSIVVDYEQVDKLKWNFFREIFQQEGDNVLSSAEFTVFFKKNKEWLVPYAVYSYIRDQYGMSHFSQWKNYILEEQSDFQISKYGLYYFLQFHAHQQLTEVRNYARQNGIVLKGDIPIGINRESVEAFIEPHYFNMCFQAGAPPDTFSTTGQVWGFPTYNWKIMAADNYCWWKERFKKMADYFDAYRIDHILGFFRIWQIPKDSDIGLLGYFNPALPLYTEEIESWGLPFNEKTKELFIEDADKKNHYHPCISAYITSTYKKLNKNYQEAFDHLYNNYFYQRHNEFWKSAALKHLTPLVNSTNMLVCGEDLGMIPNSVPEVMNLLQILSLEIERMPKSSEQEFTDLNHVPYLSVCTTSTHDMNPIRAWWKEDEKQTQRYYNQVLKKEGIAPKNCTFKISEAILLNHLNAKSMLVIIPLQDWLSIDAQLRNPNEDAERINIPANSRHYWQYRMHLTIEELLQAKKLNDKIRSLIRLSQR